jgi:hypothetical protein
MQRADRTQNLVLLHLVVHAPTTPIWMVNYATEILYRVNAFSERP